MDSTSMLRSFLRAFMVLLFPLFHNGNDQFYEVGGFGIIENYLGNGHEQDQDDVDAQVDDVQITVPNALDWFDEELAPDLKWCLALNSEEYAGTSEIQLLTLLDTKRFGKALAIDGQLQTTEMDEFIYHESLAHPALLIHDEPKIVFIMGGGGGSTAREVLKHKDVEKVIICDIDREVVDLCREHITANREAFNDKRLQIVYNDAKDELEKSEGMFDVILGDLSDPTESGLSNNLYTKSFYEQVAKPKLKENGIFVTQAGPAGILSHKDVFSPIYNTLKQVFTHVVAYTAHVPSYADSCGWILASDVPINLDAKQLNNRIGQRIRGELRYLDGPFIAASTVLNKTLITSLMNETKVLTEENVRFFQGRGIRSNI